MGLHSLLQMPTGYLRVKQGTPWPREGPLHSLSGRGLREEFLPRAGNGVQWLLNLQHLDAMVSVPACRCAHDVLLKPYSETDTEWPPVQGCAWVGWQGGRHHSERSSERRLNCSAFQIGSVAKGSFPPPNLNTSVPASLVSSRVV